MIYERICSDTSGEYHSPWAPAQDACSNRGVECITVVVKASSLDPLSECQKLEQGRTHVTYVVLERAPGISYKMSNIVLKHSVTLANLKASCG